MGVSIHGDLWYLGRMQIGPLKIDFPVYLAPMAGISDVSFRTLMREMGAGIVVTELLSSEAMVRFNERTKRMMRLSDTERPAGIQIFGNDPHAMAETAHMAQDAGADFIDINLGCPVKKIVCQGAGAALLKDHAALAKVLSAVRAAIDIPLTIKIRTGFDACVPTYHDVIHVAEECGVAAVAIHGRTRAQGYEGFADWEAIADAKRIARVPIIGNGDLITAPLALQRWRDSGCDAIMIGRGALRNPWIFLELRALLDGKDPATTVRREPLAVLQRHSELLRHYEQPRQGLLQLKKFLAWYSTGMRGSSIFRTEIFKLDDFETIIAAGMEFFRRQEELNVGIGAGERFLMGGHG